MHTLQKLYKALPEAVTKYLHVQQLLLHVDVQLETVNRKQKTSSETFCCHLFSACFMQREMCGI